MPKPPKASKPKPDNAAYDLLTDLLNFNSGIPDNRTDEEVEAEFLAFAERWERNRRMN